MRWYDVALWPFWPVRFTPRLAFVWASSPFAAVACLMRHAGYSFVMHAAAAATDGSVLYRAHRVSIILDPEWMTREERVIESGCCLYKGTDEDARLRFNEVVHGRSF
jgi:hypothetical protein